MTHPKYTPKDIARFESKVDRSAGPDGCHPWLAGTGKDGYGGFWAQGQMHRAHRVAWELANGDPGVLCVLHQCDNPLCCNSRHHFLGTRVNNIEDMVSKGRQASGERNGLRRHPGRAARGERQHCARLTEPQVLELRQAMQAGPVEAKTWASRFGVSRATIRDVLQGATWRHLLSAE